MTNDTEARLRKLCELAVAARDHAEAERLLTEFRIALGDHVERAKISLGSQLTVLNELLKQNPE